MLKLTVSTLKNHSHFPFANVFAINLDRRQDRWRSLHDQLSAALGKVSCESRVQRIPAVDGASVNLERLRACGLVSHLGYRRLQEPKHHTIWGMDLNRGAVGCALSHLQVWARIAALPTSEHDSHHLILEDDCVIPIDFLRLYDERVQHAPAGWEMLYIGGLDTAQQCASTRVADGVCRVPAYHRTTHAYVVTPRGAQRLIETAFPLTFQLDTMLTMNVGFEQGDDMEVRRCPYVLDPICYTLQPPIVEQAPCMGSDIQDAQQPM